MALRPPFPHAAVPPDRCPACAFPLQACLCGEIPRLKTPWRFVILRHASEIPRLSNSGRWAALALDGAVLHDHARGDTPSEPALAALLGGEPAALLYPGAGARDLPEPAPRTIVVPDATWSQARRMVQRLAPLRTLPRLALPPPAPSARLRRPTIDGGMSTLEAIAGALARLGDATSAARLLELHAAAVERALRLRGMWPPDRNHHLARAT